MFQSLPRHFSLGSTRFLKVGLARLRDSPDALVVVKVFSIHDLGLNLRGYRDRLLEVKRSLEGCLNCLPFQRVWVRKKKSFSQCLMRSAKRMFS